VPPKRPRWRTAVTNPWAVGIGAPLIVAVILTGFKVAEIGTSAAPGSFIATGSVVCESGRPVVGIWIAASTGQADSGMADMGASNASGSSYRIGSVATYTYLLRHGGTYSAHVGCGGAAAHWASESFSPLLHAETVTLHCDDPTGPAVHGAIPDGRCTVSAGR